MFATTLINERGALKPVFVVYAAEATRDQAARLAEMLAAIIFILGGLGIRRPSPRRSRDAVG